MVHLSNARAFTTQLMFDEALNDAVFANSPYSRHSGRRTLNNDDSIFREPMLMKATREADGYLAVTVFGVDTDRDGA